MSSPSKLDMLPVKRLWLQLDDVERLLVKEKSCRRCCEGERICTVFSRGGSATQTERGNIGVATIFLPTSESPLYIRLCDLLFR